MGNAAAAIQGAPVTTVDIDFYFRRTPTNVKKVKAIARDLDAMILRPFYPVTSLLRIQRDIDALQIDFMSTMDGVSSIEGVRKRATRMQFGDASLLVGSLGDIIKSKKAAARPQDLAVLHILEATLAQKKDNQKGSPEGPQSRE